MNAHLKNKTPSRRAGYAFMVALLLICAMLFSSVTAHAKTDETQDGGTSAEPSVVADASESTGSGDDDDVVQPNTTTPNSATPPSSATGSTTDETPGGTGSSTGNSTSGDSTTTGKQFVIVETKSGKIFYLIIDHDKASDNVYLLTEVTENDLLNFVEVEGDGSAADGGNTTPVTPEPDTTSPTEPVDNSESEPNSEPEPEQKKSSGMGGVLMLLLVVAGGGGAAYYFFKVRRPKSEPLGSMDDFEFEDEDGDDLYEDEYPGEDGEDMEITDDV